MIPYRDENETQHPTLVTGAIVALNIASGRSCKAPAPTYLWPDRLQPRPDSR